MCYYNLKVLPYLRKLPVHSLNVVRTRSPID